jgi:hypothetical protein
MADQFIPVTSAPNQMQSVTGNINGALLTLQFGFYFSEMSGCWIMRILDKSGNLLLDSIPVICGEWPAANLLASYGYLGIGSLYIINMSGIKLDYPGPTNLGTDFQLMWSDNAA